ncbi:MAG TPA: arginine N-succinyltransferase [Deltaproteobacteria bacterium]|nr:arginine N-succinyltransferase [Deltaproteobacteria bacterium]
MGREEAVNNGDKARSRWPGILGIAAVLLIVVALLSAWWIKHNLYASPFSVTKLSEVEQRALDAKLDRLEQSVRGPGKALPNEPDERTSDGRLVPERYTEDTAKREIRITEKELNALIAKDEETARRVAIDLSKDMVSVKLVVPVENDFPLLGGKTLRLTCGITLRYEARRPVVALQGISIGGVPIPNAWLGNIKNIHLVQEFGDQGGFWKIFSEGVEDIKVSEGTLFIKLKA